MEGHAHSTDLLFQNVFAPENCVVSRTISLCNALHNLIKNSDA